MFSAPDLARLEDASRRLLSPLAAPDPEAWIRSAGDAVRDLVGGDAAVLNAPGDPTGRHGPTLLYSEDAPDVAAACNAYIAASTAEGMAFTDPFATVWHRMRQARDLGAYSSDTVAKMAREAGHRIADSPIVGGIVPESGFRDYVGVVKTSALGDATVWVLRRERGGLRFGEHTRDVLQALVPAFQAGLDTLARLGAHKAALDAVQEPLAAFDADGREIHLNAALVRILESDPDRGRLTVEVAAFARAFARRATPGRGPASGPLPAVREVRTDRAEYRLRGAALPGGAFESTAPVLVTVETSGPAVLPTAEAVRERLGLTAREAEVALLLAGGLTNSQVADRLFIAAGTARRHTENVLAKLDVPNRAAVAAAVLGGRFGR